MPWIDFLGVDDLTRAELVSILDLAGRVKADPGKYCKKLSGRTLLMMFEKPSLRTRLSFEVGMTQLGGHAIYYDLMTSPMGKKESIVDTGRSASRYVDVITARLFSHDAIVQLAESSSVPVINALTDYVHPCQMLADLQTIREKKGVLKGLKIAYVGDGRNNVTHSLMLGCALVGVDISVGCPEGVEYTPAGEIVNQANKLASSSGVSVIVTDNAIEAVKDADVVYTDSWMSYHIPENLRERRVDILKHYQVNSSLMKHAKKDALFMHCLPASRGMEVSADVIDGPSSVVFDEAENRLHVQKALMLKLLGVVK